MRNTAETLRWYRNHETKAQLGFDPDGMCLKICRTARLIAPRYPSAISAQHATPTQYRVGRVRDIEPGMVAYFDDPRDSNPYGHIVTVVGRVKGASRHLLSSLLVRTNSVRSNEIVVVRGDYFGRHWGDEFQFAATWLNGVKLDVRRPGPLAGGAPNLRAAIKELEEAAAYHKRHNHPRLVTALERDIAEIKQTINAFD